MMVKGGCSAQVKISEPALVSLITTQVLVASFHTLSYCALIRRLRFMGIEAIVIVSRRSISRP